MVHKLKWETYRQNKESPRDSDGRRLRSDTDLFGLINKADYTLGLDGSTCSLGSRTST